MDQYNPYNYDESFAPEYGGFGEGGGLPALGGGGMRNPGVGGGGGGVGGLRGPPPERELKIPTLVRDVPRPLSPPRHRGGVPGGYGRPDGGYERDLPPSLMGVGQPPPVRGGPGYERIFQFDLESKFGLLILMICR